MKPTTWQVALAAAVSAAFVVAQVPPAPNPADAIKAMKVADGFEVKVVAADPDARKPVTMTFDDRGRLWVIQYLQYPTPNGLKPVQVDQYLRTIYDRIPEPPPKGPKGNDKITIFEDPDEQGRYRKHKDFLGNLNLATGLCLGHGGAFVLQSPYLLFYADKNGDDVPDGDPEVLLEGFGMEDSHAFANSLQWGPDGWLYGAQGSTVTAKIRGIEFQQGIWRYHPRTREFELFAEGGGNTWGLDFDRRGNVIAGTNWGGQIALHQVQGGYYVKGFGKHGPLHNPYTFGYFEHIPYQNFKGGHVTCGGVLYTGHTFPEKFHNQYIAGNLLSHAIYWHDLSRKGSTFTGTHGGDLVTTENNWFRPVDLLCGPDGAVYIADWCDKRANHVDPVDNWDRTKGRIYKIQASGGRQSPDEAKPVHKLSSKELVALLSHPNLWHVREARRILAERRDPSVIPDLKKLIADNKNELALEALWALYVTGGFDETLALSTLNHANEDVRAWTVRLLGDERKVTPEVRARLIERARNETSAVVRSQLACSAKRLPGPDCLPIVRELLTHQEDVDDIHIPLLLWWAIEDKATSDRALVLGLLDKPEQWRAPLASKFLVERLARRYMAGGSDADLGTCARLLEASPSPAETELLVRGMEKALEGRYLAKVPPQLEKHLAELWDKQPRSQTTLRLALRLGSVPAYEETLRFIVDAKTPAADRAGLIEIAGQMGKPGCVPAFLKLLADSQDSKVRLAVLAALQPFQDKQIADTVLELYPKFPADLRPRAQGLLCNRPASALALLQAVDAGKITPKEVALDQLKRVVAFNNKDANKLIEKHWGKLGGASSGEKLSRMASIRNMLRNGAGDPAKGKVLFTKTCATCHTLFGEGNKIGPDLTSAERKNLDVLLSSTVDPSAFIRPEFVSFNVETKDGRILTGLIVDSNPKAVTLLDGKNEKTVVARDNIEGQPTPSPVSLMPEKLLDPFDDQEIRDLLSYLRSDGK